MHRNYFLTLLCFSLLFACSKEQNKNQLRIQYIKSDISNHDKGIQDSFEESTIRIYPNPFINETNFIVRGEGKKEIVVTNDEGKFKIIPISDNTFKLNFSEESKGAYYCEIKMGNKVTPVTLIKSE